jgi:hypothetical protein
MRHSGSRKYEKLTRKQTFGGGNFPPGTIFVLRYRVNGKRIFETLKNCPDLKTAFEKQLEREYEFLRGAIQPPAPKPIPPSKPVPNKESGKPLMLDQAIASQQLRCLPWDRTVSS